MKIDDKNQALLLLCFLPSSYKKFRETLLYGRESIMMDVVKADLFSKELMDRELLSTSESKGEAQTTRGRTSKHDSNGKKKNKFRSKSRNKNKYYNYCRKESTSRMSARNFKIERMTRMVRKKIQSMLVLQMQIHAVLFIQPIMHQD